MLTHVRRRYIYTICLFLDAEQSLYSESTGGLEAPLEATLGESTKEAQLFINFVRFVQSTIHLGLGDVLEAVTYISDGVLEEMAPATTEEQFQFLILS